MARWPSKAAAARAPRPITIFADNAFLPASIATQFGTLSNGYNAATGVSGTAAQPTQTLTIGTINTNNLDLSKPMDLTSVCNTLGVPCLKLNRTLTRGVFTLEGTLGERLVVERLCPAQPGARAPDRGPGLLWPPLQFRDRCDQGDGGQRGTTSLPIGSIQCRAVVAGQCRRRRLRAA